MFLMEEVVVHSVLVVTNRLLLTDLEDDGTCEINNIYMSLSSFIYQSTSFKKNESTRN